MALKRENITGKSLVVVDLSEDEILVEEDTMGVGEGDRFILRAVEDHGSPYLEVVLLKEEVLK